MRLWLGESLRYLKYCYVFSLLRKVSSKSESGATSEKNTVTKDRGSYCMTSEMSTVGKSTEKGYIAMVAQSSE